MYPPPFRTGGFDWEAWPWFHLAINELTDCCFSGDALRDDEPVGLVSMLLLPPGPSARLGSPPCCGAFSLLSAEAGPEAAGV